MFYWQGNIIKGAAWCSGCINFEDFYFQTFNNFRDSKGCFRDWQDLYPVGKSSGKGPFWCLRDRRTSKSSSDVSRFGTIWNQLAGRSCLVLGCFNFEDFEDSWSHLNLDDRSWKDIAGAFRYLHGATTSRTPRDVLLARKHNQRSCLVFGMNQLRRLLLPGLQQLPRLQGMFPGLTKYGFNWQRKRNTRSSLVLGWINFEDFEDSWSHLNLDERSFMATTSSNSKAVTVEVSWIGRIGRIQTKRSSEKRKDNERHEILNRHHAASWQTSRTS
ncbi:unnamed protein product [Caenorhabditis nigoni]